MDNTPLTPRDDENDSPIEPQTPSEHEGIPGEVPLPPVEPMAEQPIPPEPPTPQEEVIAGQPSPESLPPPPPPFPSPGVVTPEYGSTPPPPPPPSYGVPPGGYGTEYAAPARKSRNWLMILAIVLGVCLLLICLACVVLVLLAPNIGDVLSNIIETLEATSTPN